MSTFKYVTSFKDESPNGAITWSSITATKKTAQAIVKYILDKSSGNLHIVLDTITYNNSRNIFNKTNVNFNSNQSIHDFLSTILSTIRKIRKLEIKNCALDKSSVATILSKIVTENKLEELILTNDKIDDAGAIEIIYMLTQYKDSLKTEPSVRGAPSTPSKIMSLKEINLSGNNISGENINKINSLLGKAEAAPGAGGRRRTRVKKHKRSMHRKRTMRR